MRKILILFLLLLTTGCAYHNPLSDMQFQTTPAPPFIIANWYKITQPGDILKIYIEGDGFTSGSENPTPTRDFVRKLASDDSASNVAYVARPCQYLQVNCSPSDWGADQFSPAAVNSMDMTITALMKKAKAKQVILIGFAGGAQIATQIAVQHPEKVKEIITISPVYADSYLTESLKSQLKSIPQTHYIGDKYINSQHLSGTIITVPKADYDTGFKSIYHKIYEAK